MSLPDAAVDRRCEDMFAIVRIDSKLVYSTDVLLLGKRSANDVTGTDLRGSPSGTQSGIPTSPTDNNRRFSRGSRRKLSRLELALLIRLKC